MSGGLGPRCQVAQASLVQWDGGAWLGQAHASGLGERVLPSRRDSPQRATQSVWVGWAQPKNWGAGGHQQGKVGLFL